VLVISQRKLSTHFNYGTDNELVDYMIDKARMSLVLYQLEKQMPRARSFQLACLSASLRHTLVSRCRNGYEYL